MNVPRELRQIGAIGQAREIRQHVWYKCPPGKCPGDEDVPRSCQYCDGGLAFCTVCKKGEGELEDSCPGPSDGEIYSLASFGNDPQAKEDFIMLHTQTPTNCPTCGRTVPGVFEHVDVDCENWPDRGEALPHMYRDYEVSVAEYCPGFQYVHKDYDGPEDNRGGHEVRLDLIYRAIDEREDG